MSKSTADRERVDASIDESIDPFVHANETECEKEFALCVGRPVNAKMLTGRQLGQNHKWNMLSNDCVYFVSVDCDSITPCIRKFPTPHSFFCRKVDAKICARRENPSRKVKAVFEQNSRPKIFIDLSTHVPRFA